MSVSMHVHQCDGKNNNHCNEKHFLNNVLEYQNNDSVFQIFDYMSQNNEKLLQNDSNYFEIKPFFLDTNSLLSERFSLLGDTNYFEIGETRDNCNLKEIFITT